MKRIAQTLGEMNRKLLRVNDLVITTIPDRVSDNNNHVSNCARAHNHASNCRHADNCTSNCVPGHNHADEITVWVDGERREAKLFEHAGKLKLRVTLYETDNGKLLEVKGAVLAATQGAEKGAECDASAPML
jgi:hypothetical protein